MTATARRYSPADVARLLDRFAPTDEQARIIQAPLSPAVVIAAAGSGKTETMAARVVWLVANGLAQPDRILGLTFTRKAAGELQQRIRSRLKLLHYALGDDPASIAEPTVLTYAAYAGRIVAEHAILLGSEPDSTLLSEAARWQVADAVVRRYDGEFELDPGVIATVSERTLNLAGQLADHLVSGDQLERECRRLLEVIDDLPPSPKSRTRAYPPSVQRLRESLLKRLDLLPLVQRFEQAKSAQSTHDFADQMVLATLLSRLPVVAEVERSRYDVILLDEYQDTGFAQIEMLAALFGDGRAVTAVGDPLQSIYGWRGASPGNIHHFPQRFRTAAGDPATVFSLMTSWRNDENILRAANTVAAPLITSGGSALRARPNAPAGHVEVAYLDTIESEAAWLAAKLRTEWNERPQWTDNRRTLAILVRKRSGIAIIAQAVRAAGLPVEVVDLGGLLTLAEIADIRAVLQIMSDHNSGGSLMRLLAGARCRIGPADLVALHERARQLARSAAGPIDADDDERIDPSLIEALDDLGEQSRYSTEGFSRLSEIGGILRRLRRRLDLPIPDLIGEIEQALGLDVEVAARPGLGEAGRANLDRFIDEAARFVGDRKGTAGSGLSAFLGYLKAAELEEYGLKPATIEVHADRVQILTVHGAKGLEWDVVVVAGLVADGFPDAAKNHDWATAPALLPSRLRGDHAQLPELDDARCADRGELEARILDHKAALKDRHRDEERRLAYVAATRARMALYASGAAWGTGSTAREPSIFLSEFAALTRGEEAVAVLDRWHEVAPGEVNPRESIERASHWPFDPLGDRRSAVAEGAALVSQARRRVSSPAGAAAPSQAPAAPVEPSAPSPARSLMWQRDVSLLLAELEAAGQNSVIEVGMPKHLSVSDVVALSADEAELARRVRRPLPRRPVAAARRGSNFHSWLEQRWQAASLLDVDELPGAADDVVDDAELAHLKHSFEASRWADKTPVAVEVPFEMSFGATVVRGRMDAVFAEPDGRFTIIDWKTGAVPGSENETGVKLGTAQAVQLAVYRLAWAALRGISARRINTISAAFYYVGADTLVTPSDLLSAAQLNDLINGSTPSGDSDLADVFTDFQ